MIKGLGVDIVESKRFTNMKDSASFLNKYYSKEELILIDEKGLIIAIDNFAVKEAVSKVFGTGVRGFGLNEIEVLRDKMGKPYVNLLGNAKEISQLLGISSLFVTISNTSELSVAVAVGEG
ncbi:MAG: hypothetical protein K0R15_161 [Clostridiales bacterium]|jgi:holo-[acyl-carrier protein] synthase|nr:hypothetical protein [Clostridiales bacterium]